jgi:CRP-like cAMP-binding protein
VTSILFAPGDSQADDLAAGPPDYFADLNLDQVVASLTAGREQYDLEPFFHTPLASADAVAYRHEVLRDLEDAALRSRIGAFAEGMDAMRDRLARARRARYRHEKDARFLEAAEQYRDAVVRLADDLAAAAPASRALRALRQHLEAYVGSPAFSALRTDTERVRGGLAGVRYSLTIAGNRVDVARYDGEPDYSAEVAETFAKFRQGEVRDYRARFSPASELNHVEAAILDRVAQLHPDVFAALDDFCGRHRDYVDDDVARFDREVQFYLAFVEHIGRLTAAGLRFCCPEVTTDKVVGASETFDLALAGKLVADRQPVVCNDFRLDDPERIIVVSGPNQGGKTTFARTFGQLHHLAAIGCPVPGASARLHLCDRIFTHFEREEALTTLSGKLEDDLVRVHEILALATPDSVVVMNESFSSTTLHDALRLGRAVMERLIALDVLCVYVTFVDELASLGETTVSMVSAIVPGDPASRTYRLERRPADGLAYAAAIAQRYGLTYDRVRERVAG